MENENIFCTTCGERMDIETRQCLKCNKEQNTLILQYNNQKTNEDKFVDWFSDFIVPSDENFIKRSKKHASIMIIIGKLLFLISIIHGVIACMNTPMEPDLLYNCSMRMLENVVIAYILRTFIIWFGYMELSLINLQKQRK